MDASYLTPKEIAAHFSQRTAEKSQLTFFRFALLAILGGAFIALGGLLAVVVTGGSPALAAENPGVLRLLAGALFPVGIIMVAIAGADLFTSDCAGVVLAKLDKKISAFDFLKIIVFSYAFNFLGAQFVAYFMAAESGLFSKEMYANYLHTFAAAKLGQSFWVIFLKGIGANWLVCLAVWMAYAAKDVAGKCIAIWVPVMVFVTLGYEHSIANMFFIPAAIYTGADITWGGFIIQNLIPATLGNLAGGMAFVGCIYWYIYSSPAKRD